MKKNLFLLMMVIAPLLAFCQQTKKQIIFSSGGTTDTTRYFEYLPQGYASNTKAYTVVIFLHGLGQRGNNELQMNRITALSGTPPYQAANNTDFPFVLLSPQLKEKNSGWYGSVIDRMIKAANRNYRVKHIYIVGLSLGGGGAWLAATNTNLNETPSNDLDNVKGIVTVCGTNSSLGSACNVVENDLLVWSFHGTSDITVLPSNTTDMITAINGCNPGLDTVPKLTLYTGDNHEIWSKTFSLTNDFHLPNVYQWIMSTNSGTPTADAGADQATTSTSIILSGSGTDNDGTIASYLWTQVPGVAGGPNVATLTGSTSAAPTVSNLIPGTYVFRLQVTDDNAWPSTPDEITVTVTNPPPVVNAGADKFVSDATTTFTGSATDNGSIAVYLWTKISGGTATLTNATTTTVSIADLVGGVYVFRLTATDNLGASSYDDVTLTVNSAPIANAGVNITITLPTDAATFTGSGTDSDGTISSFLWSQYEGPSTATLTNASTATVTTSNLVVGKYGFRLRVKDNNNASGYDYMNVTVVSGAREATPEPVTLAELEAETKHCDDCSIIIYNMNGKRFYSGLFDYEQYKTITKSLHLYCYTLMRNSKKVDSGKVLQR